MSEQIAAVRALCDALGEQDWTRIRTLFTEDAVLVEGARRAVDRDAEVKFSGIDSILEFFQSETGSGNDFVLSPTDFMEDGNRVAMFWESRWTDTGKAVVSRGVDVFAFRGSRISEGRVYLDMAPEL